MDPLNEKIKAIEAIESKTNKNIRNLMTLRNLKKRQNTRKVYTEKVNAAFAKGKELQLAKIKKEIEQKDPDNRSKQEEEMLATHPNDYHVKELTQATIDLLNNENKALLIENKRYRDAETKRTDRSECIYNMLNEVEKKEVITKMTTLVNSFTEKRKEGEALGFIAPALSAGATVTTGSIATLATMGAVIATGPYAIPITVGLVAIGAIVGFYLKQKALNEELQGNLIAIKGEVERFYFIYKVIEQIAKEKNLNLNTTLVRKFTILLTNNILTVAGPEVFALLKKAVNENPDALFTPEQVGPLESFKSLDSLEKKKQERPTLLSRIFTPSVQRLVIPAELLRIIIRDVTILSIFFTIMQSEFDLLVREYDAKQKKKLLDVIQSDSSLSGPVKEAFGKYFKEDTWLDSDEYFRFKCNLPFNNLDLVQTVNKELTGGLELPASAPLPSVDGVYESNPASAVESNSSGGSTPVVVTNQT